MGGGQVCYALGGARVGSGGMVPGDSREPSPAKGNDWRDAGHLTVGS